MQYFSRFWDDNAFKHIAYNTNLYRTQQTVKSIETNEKEIEVFFGVQMKMQMINYSTLYHYLN